MNDLDLKIRELSKNNKLEKIEILLEKKLKSQPNNIELLLRLALVQLACPLEDYYKSIDYIHKLLSFDKNNILANMLLAHINYCFLGGIDENLLNRLLNLSNKTDCAELKSMLKFCISLFYTGKDSKLERQFLIESITAYNGHVWNYVNLAVLCKNEGLKDEGKMFIDLALKNIKKIYDEKAEEFEDVTDINEYFNEHIKGIHLTDSNLKMIKDIIK